MKIAFDENVPPPVVRAVEALLDGRAATIKIVSARSYSEPPAKSDVPWLEKFAQDKGHVVITGDKRMRSRPHERQAIEDLGLIVIFLPPKWSNLAFNRKSGFFFIGGTSFLCC